jgi:UDP-N-acetylglucosamine diphosphorylase/glucosamine-1-phosphate N-acetyltransferase
MKLILYEDQADDFYPLINLYPQYNLQIGGRSLIEHARSWFSYVPAIGISERLHDHRPATIKAPSLYLSARFVLTKKIKLPQTDCAFVCDETVVGMVKHRPPYPTTIKDIKRVSKHMKQKRDISGLVLRTLWDCIRFNSKITELHADIIPQRSMLPKTIIVVGNRKNVYIKSGAVIQGGVIVDVTSGPVIIDQHVCLRSYTTITGPSYIGPGTILDRAKITASSIGPMCRISGEVEACIFQGYSNKSHEGYVGHSFIGEWVNLGALTTNSDLKNNYQNVRVRVRRSTYDTGMIKVGCFIGDHTKTGIGTLIPTGAVIGSFVNFFGGGMMPCYVKDFTWLTCMKQEVYTLKKALETARVVMKRRGKSMTPAYRQLIKDCYKWRNS